MLVVFLALVGSALLVLNGPGARWMIGKTLRKQLAKLDLSGDLVVEGRLLSGFVLRNGEFSGGGLIEKLHFEELGVGYRLPDLLDKKIERVWSNGIVVTIDPSKAPERERDEPRDGPLPDFQALGNTLRTVRELVLPIEIDLGSLDLTIRRPDAEDLAISFASLGHDGSSSTITLSGISSNLLGDEGLRPQDLVATWDEQALRLSRLDILPDLAVRSLNLSLPEGGIASAETWIDSFGSEFHLQADEGGTVDASLSSGSLDLSRVDQVPDLELGGTIEQLTITAEHLLDEPSTWQARVNVAGKDLEWPGGTLEHVRAEVELDESLVLTAAVRDDLELEASAPAPTGQQLNLKSWLQGLPVTIDLRAPSLHTAIAHALPAAGQELPPMESIPEGAVRAAGSVTVSTDGTLPVARLDWSFQEISIRGKTIPDLRGTASLQDDTASATVELASPRTDESLVVRGGFHLRNKTYDAHLTAELPDPAWLLPLLPDQDPLWKPVGAISLDWNGNGHLEVPASHDGDLEIRRLNLTAPGETVTEVEVKGDYQWPGSVNLPSVVVRNGDLHLEGSLSWLDDTVTITELHFHDGGGPMTEINGSLPLSPEALTLEEILAQDRTLTLTLKGSDLRLVRLTTLLPIDLPDGFAAALDYDLTFSGTPGQPTLSGFLEASDVQTPGPEGLPPFSARITFETNDRTLTAAASVTEPGGKLVELRASLPINLQAILDDPEQFKSLPVDATATIDKLVLARLQLFAPLLAEAEGTLSANLSASGPLTNPTLAGTASLDLERFPLPNLPHREVGPSRLAVKLEGNSVEVDPTSIIRIAGGTVEPKGRISLVDGQPVFALEVAARSLLAWRNDSFIARANSDLRLDGPLDAARLSGNIEVIESLFYKEIELIPIGVPVASVPKPQLPTIDQEKAAVVSTVPEPFANWTLDLNFRTGKKDPILIRGGNFATGQVTADVKIDGTIADPKPSRTIQIEKASVRLPLSGKLSLTKGTITLRPEAPYDPLLDLRGSATIDRYNINLNIYGSVASPEYNLTSDPPLPESEILTLLATGTTTGALEGLDRDSATMKGAQLAINWLKDRLQKPGKESWVQSILAGLDEIELNVGENDPFSGRRLNSATLEIMKGWYLSAAVDATGNTRGVVIFSVRFR